MAFNEAALLDLGASDPESPGRNLLSVLELTGNVDAARLHEAFARVLARHDNLRTTFVRAEDGWRRRVHPEAAPALDVVDVTGEADPEAAARAAVRAVRDTVFDVGALPLARARLVRLAPERSWLVCVCEHILVDGLAVGLLLGEVGAIYGALGAGRDPALPPAPQPADHAAALAFFVAEAEAALADLPRPANPYALPLDHPRPERDDHAGDNQQFLLVPGGALRAACEARGWPFAAPLMAALQAALARHARRPDVAYSLVRAGRPGPAAKGVLGYLAWGDMIDATFVPGDRWADVVARAAATLADHAPVRMLRNPRLAPPGRRVVLNVNRWRVPGAFGDLGVQLRFDIEQVVSLWSTHDLFFQVFDTPMGVLGGVRWRRSVLDRATVAGLVEDLRGNIGAILADPDGVARFE